MSNQSVTDDIILEGFRSLAQAMAEGFDNTRADITALKAEIGVLRTDMNRRFAEMDHRMMRRFDERDMRIDDHEGRITTLETQR